MESMLNVNDKSMLLVIMGTRAEAIKMAPVMLALQEEAPALGKPVLVLRNETERPEAVDHGVVRLVGTNEAVIVAEGQRVLDNVAAQGEMARGASPYGDGHAVGRIVECMRQYYLISDRQAE